MTEPRVQIALDRWDLITLLSALVAYRAGLRDERVTELAGLLAERWGSLEEPTRKSSENQARRLSVQLAALVSEDFVWPEHDDGD